MTSPRISRALALALPLLALAACSTETATTAASAANTGRQCFYGRNVQSFAFINDSALNIRVGVNDVYRLDLFAPCVGASFVQGLALTAKNGGSDFICNPIDAELVVPSPSGPQRCLVNSIRKLTPQDVAALDPKFRP